MSILSRVLREENPKEPKIIRITTTGTNSYNPSFGCKFAIVEMVAGGGGGAGAGGGNGSAGQDTWFESSATNECKGGAGGIGSSTRTGGLGGSATISYSNGFVCSGGSGGEGAVSTGATDYCDGGKGGHTYITGGQSQFRGTPTSLADNYTGVGGAGEGVDATTGYGGGGGGGGGYARFILNRPNKKYQCFIGGGGAAGSGASANFKGSDGVILVTEFF